MQRCLRLQTSAVQQVISMLATLSAVECLFLLKPKTRQGKNWSVWAETGENEMRSTGNARNSLPVVPCATISVSFPFLFSLFFFWTSLHGWQKARRVDSYRKSPGVIRGDFHRPDSDHLGYPATDQMLATPWKGARQNETLKTAFEVCGFEDVLFWNNFFFRFAAEN